MLPCDILISAGVMLRGRDVGLESNLAVGTDLTGELPAYFADLVTPEHHIDGLVGWCASALAEGNIEQALRLSDRAIRLSKDNFHLRVLRGTTLLKAGRASQAITQFSKAVTLGGSPDGEIGLVHAYIALRDIGAAGDVVRSLLAGFAVRNFSGIVSAARSICEALEVPAPGWVSFNAGGHLVGEIDLRPLASDSCFVAEGSLSGREYIRKTIAEIGAASVDSAGDHFCGFDYELRGCDFSEPIHVSVGGAALLGSPAKAPLKTPIEGWVEKEGDQISGWAWLPQFPSEPVTIRVVDQKGGILEFPTDLTAEGDAGYNQSISCYARQRFSIDLGKLDITGPLLEVWAWLPTLGVGRQLAGSPIGINGARPINLVANPDAADRSSRGQKSRSIDVVIPVYGNVHETLACLNSVIPVRGYGDGEALCEIVVIDDASADTELTEALSALAAQNVIHLLRNERNLGFPATVNRGFELHPDRDVVVLNSDTVVFADWLSRLRDAAYREPDIGTVTPFSNEASIVSYPDSVGGNAPLPDGEAAALDEVASRVNAKVSVEIPTAVGFCMYVRRDCLNEVGLFDISSFGRGYGEENDFCMRARASGWRHVAAPNVFVSHTGGQSFGESKRMLVERNIRILNELHPGYDALVQDFIKADPLAEARRNIDIDRLRPALDLPVTLLITLDLPGGVARYVAESVSRLIEAGRSALILQPYRPEEGTGGRAIVRMPHDETFSNLIFDLPSEMDALLGLFTACRVDAVEIHHVLGHNPIVLNIPDRLSVPYEVIVHDYSWVCPRITLMDGRGRYCGMPTDARVCERCLAMDGSSLNEQIRVQDLRDRSSRVLAGAKGVVTSCGDVTDRFRSFFPAVRYQISPWEEPRLPVTPVFRSPTQGRTRVAIIGAIGQQKGYDLLLSCARDAAMRDLPIEFVVIGFTQDDLALFKTGRVFVTGRYDEAEAADIIRAQSCHFAFLPSVSPETWSYALTLAWEAGLAALAFDYGAIAERIRATGYGHLMPFSADEQVVNLTLLNLSQFGSLRSEELSKLGDLASIRDTSTDIIETAGNRLKGGENMDPTRNDQGTSLQSRGTLLPLVPGIYSFSLGDVGQPAKMFGSIALPAVQIVVAPGQSSDATVDFLGKGNTQDKWLVNKGDVVVVRVSGAPCTFLINTFRPEGQSFSLMPVECRRLDMPTNAENSAAPSGGRRILRAQITAHIQNRGDLPFVGLDWAGCLGQRLWIEAFTITPLEGIEAKDIEYKAITSNGWETPWVAGGNICGTRGAATPITGFAIRLRGACAQNYDCEYSGAFFSAGLVGPVRNGAACKPQNMKDPLEGIKLEIIEKVPSGLNDLREISSDGNSEFEPIRGSAQ